jgi:hypothetical protein
VSGIGPDTRGRHSKREEEKKRSERRKGKKVDVRLYKTANNNTLGYLWATVLLCAVLSCF